MPVVGGTSYMNFPQRLFFRTSWGKSDAADPFLIIPNSISDTWSRNASSCPGGSREAKSIQ